MFVETTKSNIKSPTSSVGTKPGQHTQSSYGNDTTMDTSAECQDALDTCGPEPEVECAQLLEMDDKPDETPIEPSLAGKTESEEISPPKEDVTTPANDPALYANLNCKLNDLFLHKFSMPAWKRVHV